MVVDFIPLAEIHEITFNIVDKGKKVRDCSDVRACDRHLTRLLVHACYEGGVWTCDTSTSCSMVIVDACGHRTNLKRTTLVIRISVVFLSLPPSLNPSLPPSLPPSPPPSLSWV
jgi:hypothetical protein